MCTLLETDGDIGCCFLEPTGIREDEKRFKGCNSCVSKCNNCTCDAPINERELFGKTGKSPTVDKLSLRCACCCCNQGCNYDTSTCLGVGQEVALCCMINSFMCTFFKEDPKYGRACCRDIEALTCCGCEGEEMVFLEKDIKGLCLFCINIDGMNAIKCCPKQFRCCRVREQCCCVYTKVGCCADEVPCEIAFCGFHCSDKRSLIKEYEAEHPEDFYEGTSVEESFETTVKGGAPLCSNTMQRE